VGVLLRVLSIVAAAIKWGVAGKSTCIIAMDIKTIYTAVMDILSEIYHDHLERLERVGVLEHLV
jgi:hypothetical protein